MPPTTRPTPRTVLWQIALLCLAIRLVLQLLGMASVASKHNELSIDMWNHWDAPHYLRVAEVGYTPDEPVPTECRQFEKPLSCDDPLFIVFFPFFPAAVAAVALVARNLVASGMVVSYVASVFACWYLYRLVERRDGHEQAWRTVLLLLSFPTAYFLATPYSEALFLAAVTASMYAAQHGAWARSGIAGAVATGTRVTGLALFPALLVESLRYPAPATERLKRLAAIGLVGAGAAVYLLINQLTYGDPLHFLDVQRAHWFQHFVPPWRSIADAVQALRAGSDTSPDATFIYAGRLAGFAFALPVLVLGLRRLRASDSVYAWTGFLLILSASWLLSLPRYLLVLYPIFMVMSGLLRSRQATFLAITTGSVIQGWLFWRYAVGAWTF